MGVMKWIYIHTYSQTYSPCTTWMRDVRGHGDYWPNFFLFFFYFSKIIRYNSSWASYFIAHIHSPSLIHFIRHCVINGKIFLNAKRGKKIIKTAVMMIVRWYNWASAKKKIDHTKLFCLSSFLSVNFHGGRFSPLYHHLLSRLMTCRSVVHKMWYQILTVAVRLLATSFNL